MALDVAAKDVVLLDKLKTVNFFAKEGEKYPEITVVTNIEYIKENATMSDDM